MVCISPGKTSKYANSPVYSESGVLYSSDTSLPSHNTSIGLIAEKVLDESAAQLEPAFADLTQKFVVPPEMTEFRTSQGMVQYCFFGS